MDRRTFLGLASATPVASQLRGRRRTEVSIRADQFLINGQPTYGGRTYEGMKIEGLLMNLRAVQGIFDDLNPETRGKWAYPDTGKWDPERNTGDSWQPCQNGASTVCSPSPSSPGRKSRGLLQGPAVGDSAIDPDGNFEDCLRAASGPDSESRDELGMVAIVAISISARISE